MQVVIKDETIWATQNATAQLFAVGYRVSSARATKFRIWATKILNEYIRKGFVLDDNRMKQGEQIFGECERLPLFPQIPNSSRQRQDSKGTSRRKSRKRIQDFQQDTTHLVRFRQGNQTTERRIGEVIVPSIPLGFCGATRHPDCREFHVRKFSCNVRCLSDLSP